MLIGETRTTYCSEAHLLQETKHGENAIKILNVNNNFYYKTVNEWKAFQRLFELLKTGPGSGMNVVKDLSGR